MITSFDLPECLAAWTLYGNPNQTDKDLHSYLILSKENSTMILETGEELQEVTNNVEFVANEPTLNAGNMLDNKIVAQIYKTGVRLLENLKSLHESKFTDIIQSFIFDPYILLNVKSNPEKETSDKKEMILLLVKENPIELVQLPVILSSVCSL